MDVLKLMAEKERLDLYVLSRDERTTLESWKYWKEPSVKIIEEKVHRTTNALHMDVIIEDTDTNRTYKIEEVFVEQDNNTCKRTVCSITHVNNLNGIFVPSYLINVYSNIQLTYEEKERLLYDYLSDTIDIVKEDILSVNPVEIKKNVIFKLVDKYFLIKLIQDLENGCDYIDEIFEVEPRKIVTTVYAKKIDN